MNFIIIDSVYGQYNLDFATPNIDFFVIKQFILQQSWDQVKDNENAYLPVLSTSPDASDDSKFIEEDKPLEYYKLQNGGVIFLHYVKFSDFN